MIVELGSASFIERSFPVPAIITSGFQEHFLIIIQQPLHLK